MAKPTTARVEHGVAGWRIRWYDQHRRDWEMLPGTWITQEAANMVARQLDESSLSLVVHLDDDHTALLRPYNPSRCCCPWWP